MHAKSGQVEDTRRFHRPIQAHHLPGYHPTPGTLLTCRQVTTQPLASRSHLAPSDRQGPLSLLPPSAHSAASPRPLSCPLWHCKCQEYESSWCHVSRQQSPEFLCGCMHGAPSTESTLELRKPLESISNTRDKKKVILNVETALPDLSPI